MPPETLTLCQFSLAVILQSNDLYADEAGGVPGCKVANLIHRALTHIVELLGHGILEKLSLRRKTAGSTGSWSN